MRIATLAVALVAAILALGAYTQSGSTARPAGGLPDLTCQGGFPRQIFSEDFEDFDESEWTIGGDARWRQQNGDFVVTDTDFEQAGRIYWAQKLSGCGFRAEFDYDISGGSGADGLTLGIAPTTDYDEAFGGGLDFCPGEEGYFAVEFDTFVNGGTDPPGQHVGIIEGCPDNHLASELATVRGAHHATVDFLQGQVNVYLDGNLVFARGFPNAPPFEAFLGVTAGTGGATDNHVIDNFTIAVINPHQGDLDCNGTVTGADAVLPLLHITGLLDDEPSTCPPLEAELLGGNLFADVNCDGVIDIDDVMAIIIFAADFTQLTPQGCTPIGDPL
jgi:hypothetical protein